MSSVLSKIAQANQEFLGSRVDSGKTWREVLESRSGRAYGLGMYEKEKIRCIACGGEITQKNLEWFGYDGSKVLCFKCQQLT